MFFRKLKWSSAVALLIVLGIVVAPRLGGTDRNEADTQRGNMRVPEHAASAPRFEAAQKQALVQQDVRLTEQLCRSQCRASLRKAANRLEGMSAAEAQQQLETLRREHPRMMRLEWHAGGRTEQRAAADAGTMEAEVRSAMRQYLDEAKRSLHAGQAYESPRVEMGGDHYYVLAAPGKDGSGITGVIRQNILDQVSRRQHQNLRLVPYPAEGKYKIESVDSDTHRDVTVQDGEDNAGTSHYHKQQVVVKFNAHPPDGKLEQIRRELQASSVRKLGYTYVFESGNLQAEQMLEYFRAREDVVYAEPHYLYMTNDDSTSIMTPNDYLYEDYQWNLPITQTLPGWTITRGDDEIRIAVVDTGVDLGHSDLDGRLVQGINIVDKDREPEDDVGHGTHVAGIISALVNNGEGVAGMTWYDKVMPVKVLDETGAGTTYSVAEGIIWATDQGAKVINLSLGNYAKAAFLHDAIKYAFDNDVVLVAATGNDNTEEPGYPAAYEEVLAVSATDEQRRRAAFSNFGEYVDVVAPGVGIASTYPDNQYAALSGTSMAAPHVSALAALIRAVNPLLRNTEVMDIIRHTADDLGAPGRDPQYGYGQINVVAALEEARRMSNSLRLLPEWVRRDIERLHAAGPG